MKKLIWLLMICLLATGSALADESAQAKLNELEMTVSGCRQENGTIAFDWSVTTADDVQEVCFMDVGRAAVSSGAISQWALVEGPMQQTGLEMVVLGFAGETLNSDAMLTLTGELEYPLQIAFHVDFYESITKTSSLDLTKQRWRMVRSEENKMLVEARPDLPYLNNNSNIPKVLEDFDALVQPGEGWEAQLSYVREHAKLCRLAVKIYELAKHLGAYEVTITFEAPDTPGNVRIEPVQ